MKACYIESYGGLDVLRLGELPDPTSGRGQALIEVEAASVNPVDWKIRQGDLKLITGRAFPKVLGIDFAGRIRAIGSQSAGLAVGDRVYGPTQLFTRHDGSHAELVAVKAKNLRLIPEGMTPVQAASLPCAALTAVNGMRHWPSLAGRRVVVNGATGGVGHFDLIHANDWLTGNAMQYVQQGFGTPAVLTMHSTEYGRAGNMFCDGLALWVRDT